MKNFSHYLPAPSGQAFGLPHPHHARIFTLDRVVRPPYSSLVPAPPEDLLTRHFATRFGRPALGVLAFGLIVVTNAVTAAGAQNNDTNGTNGTKVTGCPTTSGSSVCYATFQGGVSRRGFNPNEPALTQAAVTAITGKTFHRQFSTQVNGAVYAQPLVLPNVVMNGTTYANVAYVATQQDAVYAIDGASGKIL